MKVMVIGSGGREHALCWAIAASPLCDKVFCAPGNAGIAEDATCVPLQVSDHDGLIGFCRDESIDFVVIGPEDPLVAGLADRFAAAGIKHFGPSAAAAQLEGSKGFTKDLCAEAGIPTAAYRRVADLDAARRAIADIGAPLVVKADGLAAGKGVLMCETVAQAEAAAAEVLGGQFGSAGAELVIEEWMVGEEASFFALCDGTHVLALATAQDHKRVGDGDTGLNTGGMGAYSPAPVMTDEVVEQTMARIIRPTAAAMAARGTPFKGVFYAGLMITAEGPKLIEYNVRFGDPECQVLMARLRSDLLPALIACADGVLDKVTLRWKPQAALLVVMATDGYPGSYEKGSEIKGLEAVAALPEVIVFHAATQREGQTLRAHGGRVLGITALGETIAEAQETAYRAVDMIDWPGGFCRRDIGWRAVKASSSKGDPK
ncbi:MAG: phosphoribosylamine--glycine ligase [Roseitalea porphyridii]